MDNISKEYFYQSKKCDFLKLRYLYSDFVSARYTGHFAMAYFSESRKSLDFCYEIKLL